MKIVTYDEIDPEQANLLTLVCFGVPMTPKSVELIRKLDKRTPDYYGVYALDDTGRPVSQVIVLHIDTKTIDGIEKIAGIAAVGTLPSHSRRGLSTALMKRAHELSSEQGLRISMLTTSASLLAYDMYSKLGYSTLATFDRGIKPPANEKKRKSSALKLRSFRLTDANALGIAFVWQTVDALGFVCRQPDYLAMRVRTQQTSVERIKVATAGSKIVGYTLSLPGEDYTEIQELIGIDHSSRLRILESVEGRQKRGWLICSGVCDRRLSSLYTTEGFSVYQPGWGRIMATSLDGTLNNEEIANLYGVNEGRFVINALDSF